MNQFNKGLPSLFTSLGLISGCISIVFSVSHKDLTIAGYFILVAAVFDFIDGMVARVLNSSTSFGKQLDSLADVVSFGVAPAMILCQLMHVSIAGTSSDFDYINPTPGQSVILYSSFLVAVFSALRLAKFNLDPGQEKSFIGLPTPANAILISAVGFMAESNHGLNFSHIIFNRFFLLAVILLSCYLLISNIRMFSLKFSSLGIQKNLIRYLFLLFSACLILFYGFPGLGPVIILYIIMSVINNRFVKAN